MPPSSFTLTVDGVDLTAKASLKSISFGMRLTSPLSLSRCSHHTYRVTFLDDSAPSQCYEFKAGFDTDCYARRFVGRWGHTELSDASPVPIGAMVLWPAATPVPMGWALCDGTQGTVNLAGAAPASLVYIRKLGY